MTNDQSTLFSFGLWTVGNPGRDPFGHAVRPVQDPCRIVQRLGEIGARGVNLHDEYLVPFGSSAAERDRIVADFKKAMADSNLMQIMSLYKLSADYKKKAAATAKPKKAAP